MDDNKYNIIKKEYISFKETIEKEIKNNKSSYHYNDFLLVNYSWIKKLNENFIQYENKKIFLLPNEQPEIINDRLSALNCFKEGLKLQLVSKKLFNLIFEEKLLIALNTNN